MVLHNYLFQNNFLNFKLYLEFPMVSKGVIGKLPIRPSWDPPGRFGEFKSDNLEKAFHTDRQNKWLVKASAQPSLNFLFNISSTFFTLSIIKIDCMPYHNITRCSVSDLEKHKHSSAAIFLSFYAPLQGHHYGETLQDFQIYKRR